MWTGPWSAAIDWSVSIRSTLFCDDCDVTRDHVPQKARLVWCGCAAFGLGLLYALVSAYWAAGGTAGLDTVGGDLERWGRARDPTMVAVLWLTAGLKLIAAVLGLALVRKWGKRLPRWTLLALSWGATAVLVLYGGSLVVGQALVKAGVIEASADVDWKAFDWHLFLWDPWFLIWGLLLGATTWGSARQSATR
ncbi:DUF3995 domain-containing protein [Streptomyces boncukensis]|uniref:DUF3995 domain-containing protein n=1 Tax=Streptomyces boncukensis TaxID=2711219 RepID=A0A6G4X466_9ACTN|nr:DUF3995 domain-containing protein [Streptomyces boncukensis]NGO71670.1 DUF3995 domain-containing protein [Streptomyces boncukensis]